MKSSASLSLEELVAVNDELAALVRAGVPLEATLGEMGHDLPGRMGRATSELASHMEQGASLSQALASMPEAFPPMYCTAVEAGLRAGRLPVVLEDLARSARRLNELRQVVSTAAIYPLIVVLLTISLFGLLSTKIMPAMVRTFEGHATPAVRWIVWLGERIAIWGPAVPLAMVAIGLVCWLRLGRGTVTLRWLPVAGKMLRDARVATFSEIMALLLDHDVPLSEALPLAAEASGDPGLARSARPLADQLAQGVTALTLPAENELPPFFVWLLGTGHRKELLVPLLEQSAEMYRRRALRRSDWIRLYVPVLMTLVIAGAAVLLFALSMFVPLTDLLYEIATDDP